MALGEMMVSDPWCFVIGPIGESGSETRKRADMLLEYVIRPALAPLGFDPIKRADADADPGSITDALIRDVLEAPLVVADLTNFNPNAFYELGIRHASRLPTIHVIAEMIRLPFDNQDQRTIFVDLTDYYSMTEAVRRVAAAAELVRQPNYQVSNPVTRAGAVFELGARQDPRDEVIASMNERMEGLERSVLALSHLQLNAGPSTWLPRIEATAAEASETGGLERALNRYSDTARKKLAERELLSALRGAPRKKAEF